MILLFSCVMKICCALIENKKWWKHSAGQICTEPRISSHVSGSFVSTEQKGLKLPFFNLFHSSNEGSLAWNINSSLAWNINPSLAYMFPTFSFLFQASSICSSLLFLYFPFSTRLSLLKMNQFRIGTHLLKSSLKCEAAFLIINQFFIQVFTCRPFTYLTPPLILYKHSQNVY